MRKKSLVLSCVAVMCLFFSTQVYASETEKENDKVDKDVKERVYKELLNNQITNEEDTIKVALEQYEERRKAAAYNQGEVEDESFFITQVVDEYVDENGDTIENVRTTNLLVLDKNDNVVTPASAHSGSVGISQYQIYAYMNVDITVNRSNFTVRLNWFTTNLIYGTAMKASTLTQDSKWASEPFFEYADITKTTNSPSANVSYKYIPNNKNMINYGNLGTGRSCRSIIKAGSRTAILAFGFSNNAQNGEWTTSQN